MFDMALLGVIVAVVEMTSKCNLCNSDWSVMLTLCDAEWEDDANSSIAACQVSKCTWPESPEWPSARKTKEPTRWDKKSTSPGPASFPQQHLRDSVTVSTACYHHQQHIVTMAYVTTTAAERFKIYERLSIRLPKTATITDRPNGASWRNVYRHD